LEQMMFDRPILVYDVPFNREVVQDGGIFFKDSSSLASTIDQLESNKVNKEEKVKILSERISSTYNWEKVTEQYENVFSLL